MTGLVFTIVLLAALPARADEEVFRFAVAGDCRNNPQEQGISAQDRLWTVNSAVYSRIMRDVAAAKAKVLFFTGDMIFGHSSDACLMNRQYAFWRGMTATLLAAGTYVVPIAGNHETREYVPGKADGKEKQVAVTACENLWRENMGDLIMDVPRWNALTGKPLAAFDPANTPTVGGPDGVTTDQSRLSYSFDAAGMHFAIMNTDAVGVDGTAPTAWLERDLAAAKARGVTRMFVFGHRPAFTYKYAKNVKPVGLDEYPAKRDAFWKVVEKYGANYFCSHQHLYHAEKPGKGKSWQVIAGGSGAPFAIKPGEEKRPADRMHVWILARVMAGGKVLAEAYAFDEMLGETRLVESWEM
jgi:hypothetical protein